jgi:hypothetical protein
VALLGGAARASRAVVRTQALPPTFVASLTGTAQRGQTASGLATIDLSMRFRGAAPGAADVLLEGQKLPDGGLQMSRSRVTFGSASRPAEYRGRVIALNGNRIVARVQGSGGRFRRLGIVVAIARDSSLSGTIVSRNG